MKNLVVMNEKDFKKAQVKLYNTVHKTKYLSFSKLPKEAQAEIEAIYAKTVANAEKTAETAEAEKTAEATAETAEKTPKVNKKEELLAKVSAFAEKLDGEFAQTKEKYYAYRENGAIIRFQLGGGKCRIRCNNKAGEILAEASIEIEEHPNWNIKYAVLTEDYEAVLTAISAHFATAETAEAETAEAEAE